MIEEILFSAEKFRWKIYRLQPRSAAGLSFFNLRSSLRAGNKFWLGDAYKLHFIKFSAENLNSNVLEH